MKKSRVMTMQIPMDGIRITERNPVDGMEGSQGFTSDGRQSNTASRTAADGRQSGTARRTAAGRRGSGAARRIASGGRQSGTARRTAAGGRGNGASPKSPSLRGVDINYRLLAIIILFAVAAIMALVLITTAVYVSQNSPEENHICENVSLGEIDVSGMTADQAKALVETYVEGLQSEKITLQAEGKTAVVTAEDLGLYWSNPDVTQEAVAYGTEGSIFSRRSELKRLEKEKKVFPVSLAMDEKKFNKIIKKEGDSLTNEAVDFGLTHTGSTFTVTEGKTGTKIDAAASYEQLKDSFAEGWNEDPTLQLTVVEDTPKGSEEELANVRDVLGEFTTEYGASADGRKTNIRVAMEKISGKVLYPGDELDVYKVCAPFTKKNGYALAKAFENGSTVDDIGGGICQVSTTLYNAVIRAEMEVLERYGHSMIVNYVDPSEDAAIAGNEKNFRFKNSLDNPVYIEGYADGEYLKFTIYGVETRPADREVSFESEIIDKTEPTTKFVASGSYYVGAIELKQGSHTGYDAQLIKIVKENGKEVSREEFNHTSYQMSPTIYYVGVKSSNPDAQAAMYDAISTQNMSKIQAAASRWG